MFGLFGGKKEEKKEVNKPVISLGTPSPVSTPSGQTLTTSEGRDVVAVVEDLEKDVGRLKDAMNSLKESIKGLNSKLEDLERNIAQLASVYELLVNQQNPFVDREEIAPAERREVKVEERPVEREVVERGEKEIVETVKGDVVLPYIDLTNPKVIEIVIDWTRFMVEKVGHEGIDELLKYYVDIRWISEEVAEILRRYADGIRVDLEPDVGNVQLDPEEHHKSLEYILSIKDVMSR